jgi:23S rRNA (guanine745-N1)-methyltransferase
MAAKKYRDLDFVVANIKERLVLAENSVQVLLNIFAPRNPGEFVRVVAPKGLLFVVIPSPKHLKSLRSTLRLLNIEENKKKRVVEQLADGFRLVNTSTIEYEAWLSSEEVRNIVLMTPNYWHVEREKLDALEGRGAFQTEIGFTCLMFASKK